MISWKPLLHRLRHSVVPAVCTDLQQDAITGASRWLIMGVRMLRHVLQAAEAARAPSAIDESTIYGSYNTITGKVDLKGRWPQFLEVGQPGIVPLYRTLCEGSQILCCMHSTGSV